MRLSDFARTEVDKFLQIAADARNMAFLISASQELKTGSVEELCPLYLRDKGQHIFPQLVSVGKLLKILPLVLPGTVPGTVSRDKFEQGQMVSQGQIFLSPGHRP